MRQGIKKQISYIERNLSNIAKMQATCGEQTARHSAELETIKAIVAQQKHMFKNKTQSVENRIVNISQPHARPIPRGKTNARQSLAQKWKSA